MAASHLEAEDGGVGGVENSARLTGSTIVARQGDDLDVVTCGEAVANLKPSVPASPSMKTSSCWSRRRRGRIARRDETR